MLDKAKALFRSVISKVTGTHEQKITMVVDINLPDHEERVTTSKFLHTKKALIDKVDGRCWICGRNEQESGFPMEAHHSPIERSLANAVDFSLVRQDYSDFDWKSFDANNDVYDFVDDMTVNGVLLCKTHHTGVNSGIHTMPHPLWVIQRYLKEGYIYTSTETIHHAPSRNSDVK
jgi:hypothetical protein